VLIVSNCVSQVSLFAESFNEMLMRDFGFTIYKKLKTEQMAKKLEASKKAEVKVVVFSCCFHTW